jgi:hypothetical protein
MAVGVVAALRHLVWTSGYRQGATTGTNNPGLFRWPSAVGIDQPDAGQSLPQLEFHDHPVRVLTTKNDPLLRPRDQERGRRCSTPVPDPPAIEGDSMTAQIQPGAGAWTTPQGTHPEVK